MYERHQTVMFAQVNALADVAIMYVKGGINDV